MQLTQQELDAINKKLVEHYKGLHKLEKENSVGTELKRSYCLGYEDVYFEVLKFAGYNDKQRLDMYHEQLRKAKEQ